MRVGLVRKLGLSVLALGVVGLGGCNDDPVSIDATTAVRMLLNPSSMVVQTGDSVEMRANGINNANEPTFEAVTAMVGSCGGTGSITVVESDLQTSIEPPQTYNVIGGADLGVACVVVTSGAATDTVDVVVVGGLLEVTSAPTSLVVAGSGTVVVDLVGLDGTPVTPFDPTDVAWSSDNTAVLTVDASGNVASPGLSGNVNITATWTGTDATGTSGQGVSLSVVANIDVVADDPVAAVLNTAFDALAVGAQSTVVVLVTDALGNQVIDPAIILGIAASSDDMGVATASTFLDPDALQNLAATATGVGAGTANLSGTVMTSFGDFAFGPGPVFVLDPQITSLTPDNGNATGETVTVTGTGLSAVGFNTTLTLDGTSVFLFTVDSDTQITIDAMPASVGGPGARDLIVDVGGIPSAPASWTQNDSDPESLTEPLNDNPGNVTVSLPFQFSGALGLNAGDLNDLFEFTLAAPATIQFDLSWIAATGDLDLLQDDAGLGYSFPCGFPTATAAIPESGTCALPAGTYALWVNDYGADGPVRIYTVSAIIVP